jgi:hypothetical protein
MLMVPQRELPRLEGTLVLTDGDGTVSIPQCRIAEATLRRDGSGYIFGVSGLDARWKWRYGYLFGEYNVRSPNGEIVESTRKSARELVDLCFRAWGVVNAVTSVIPENDYPYVNWLYDRVRPELQSLLDRYGCSVVVDWTRMQPVVVRLGVGEELPTYPVESDDFSIDPPESPRSIVLVCQPTRMEAKFKLKAVAEDLDGTIKDLEDASLSYRPADGWRNTVTDPMNPLPEGEQEHIEAARRSVYRLYQVESFADGTMKVPGTNREVEMADVLPLIPSLLSEYMFTESGWPVPNEWYLEGTWWLGDDTEGLAHENMSMAARVPYPATLHRESGLVRLSRPLFRLGDDDRWEPAELYLVCSFELRDPETKQRLAYTRERQISNNVTKPLVMVVPELRRQLRAQYKGKEVVSITDNEDGLRASLDLLLDAAQQQFMATAGTVRQFCGIVPLQLDGLRRQATYVVDSEEGAYTRGSLSTESEVGVPRMEELRRLSLLEKRVRIGGTT